MATSTTPAHLTDEALTADLGATLPGPRRQAEILLGVPAEARVDVVDYAWHERNRLGGRLTDALYRAAHYQRTGKLEAGRRAQLTYNHRLHLTECQVAGCDRCATYRKELDRWEAQGGEG